MARAGVSNSLKSYSLAICIAEDWGMLNTQTWAKFHKTYVKAHIDYCLPGWAYCGSEQKKSDHTICRVKQIITNCRCANIENSDFKLFCLATLSDSVILLTARQYFNHVHSEDLIQT